MKNLQIVQVYQGGGTCPAPPCEVCMSNRAKVMCQDPDHHAIDLCFNCAEKEDIPDRWPIENWDKIVTERVGAKKFPLTYFTQWEGLR